MEEEQEGGDWRQGVSQTQLAGHDWRQAITHIKSARTRIIRSSCGSSCTALTPKWTTLWRASLHTGAPPLHSTPLHTVPLGPAQKSAQITRNIFRRLCRLDKHFAPAEKEEDERGEGGKGEGRGAWCGRGCAWHVCLCIKRCQSEAGESLEAAAKTATTAVATPSYHLSRRHSQSPETVLQPGSGPGLAVFKFPRWQHLPPVLVGNQPPVASLLHVASLFAFQFLF